MCELCVAETTHWVDRPLPDFYLCRATKDGNFMKAGDWGFGVCNDPLFYWSSTPMKDPTLGMSDEELDNGGWTPELEKASDEFYERYDEFRKSIAVTPRNGYLMVKAAIELGYNPEDSFEYWLFNYLATWLETHQETTT